MHSNGTTLGILAAAVLSVAIVGCSGGTNPSNNPDGGTAGTPCTETDQCFTGLVCQSGTCQATTLPDGGPLPDGGQLPEGGPLPDGGHLLPDGGACENLQCQQVTCADGGTTSVTGKVYDPSGQVPLYNAVVYVPNGPVQPIAQGVTCDICGAATSGNPLVITLTGSDGAFKLDNVPVGTNVPLVYQIGKWRRQITLPTVNACQPNPLTDVNQQRMPRNHSEGDIPKIAIATGSADPFECLLYKMGIDPAEMDLPGKGGRIDMYDQNGMKRVTEGGSDSVEASKLWSDAGTLAQYDIVLLPCEGGEHAKSTKAVNNLVNYANSGGRVFATHYSYVWTKPGWPTAADWETGQSTQDDAPNYAAELDTSFPKAQAFAEWLGNVGALDGGLLPIHEARHDVNSVNLDGGTSRWLYTDDFPKKNGGLSGHPAIQELSFNTPYDPPPAPDGGPGLQCGRVVFPDFHVTANAVYDGGTKVFPTSCKPASEAPLTPQEKALIFMLFDVSSCIQSDSTAPTTCGGVGTSCADASACCNGLACVDESFNNCSGGSCSCQVVIN